MKILLALSSPEYLRFYDATIRELAARGHHVVIAVNRIREGKPVRLDGVGTAQTGITVAGLVPARNDRWTFFARGVRGTMDFVRYLHPELAGAKLLRARVKRQGLPTLLQGLDRVGVVSGGTVSRLMNALTAVERAIPPAVPLLEFLEKLLPDVVLVSPLVEPASEQVDLLRAAQERGVRTGVLIASWDNLTNKGDLRIRPDFVVVWNEAQRREAARYHRVPPERVIVTGAQVFDRWFGREPSQTRTAFCRAVGLPDDRPFVLFTGSSIFIARADAEMSFVRDWVGALRTSRDTAVRNLRVLVRPHPYNGRAWHPDAFRDLEGVAVWPRGGYDPTDERHRAGLFDSLFHCAAVVGINTSAMIEAAIVGRPVFSIETAQFAGTQRGTLHYRYLLRENGGFLHVASEFSEHVRQLESMMRNPDESRAALREFVSRFIRPYGLDQPATPRLVEAIERCVGASTAVVTQRSNVWTRFGSILLYPLTWLGDLWLSPADRKRHRRVRAGGRLSLQRKRSESRPSAARWLTVVLAVAVWSIVVDVFAT